MNASQATLVAGAGFLAGVINSVAGGGSFFTLPALVNVGLPTVNANTTSTVALWPGTMASFGAYRRELAARRGLAFTLAIVSVFGGIVGAWILLHTPATTFDRLLPWLTLFATVLFAYGRQVAARFQLSLGNEHDRQSLIKTSALQFVIAVYGGYYGAGAGIMMLAVLSLLNMTNIHAMNAFKTLLSGAFNGAAVVIFIARGSVHWPEALTMMAGGIVGGYGGAWLAQRLPTTWVRGFVIFAGLLTTVYFFWRAREPVLGSPDAKDQRLRGQGGAPPFAQGQIRQLHQAGVGLGREITSTELNKRHPFDLATVRIPPGKSLCPYHEHSAQWELYLVVSGVGTIRDRDSDTQVGAGDAFVFRPGEAHEVSNRGTEDFVYHVVADNPVGDFCHYPDSGKWAVHRPDERRIIRGTPGDYFDGEE